MGYIFTAITGGQNVGQAFTRVNQNLAAIQNNSGGNFLALTGGTVTGPTTFIDYSSANNDFVQISGGNITFNTEDEIGSTKILFQKEGQTNTVYLPKGNGIIALVSDITGGTSSGNYLPLSGGTLTGGLSGLTFALGEGSYFNTLSSSTLTANRIVNLPNKNGTVALLNDLTGFTTGNFVPLTGTSLGSEITGDIIITNSNNLRVQDGNDVYSLELNISSIDFRDDYNSLKTRLQLTPFINSDATINMIDTLADGYMVIAPTPSGQEGKPIIVNGSGNGWEYATGGYVINTGDNITGTYNISDIGSGAAIIMSANTPSIELNGDTNATLRVFETGQGRSTSISPNQINFSRDVSGQISTLRIQPTLTTTGNSVVTLLKPIGDASSIIATVGAIAYKANQFIKVNNDGDGFDFGTISGAGTVSVIASATGFTISGANTGGISGTYVSGVTSAGTGNILLLSGTVVNNRIVQKSLLAGSGIGITESNGTITISGSGGISGTYVSGITNISGGISPISGTIVNNNIVQKAFTAGTNVTLTETNGVITIASTSAIGSAFTAATNVGTGLSIISSATNNTLRLFTLSGTNGLVVSTATTGLMTFRGPTTADRVFITDASGNMVNSDFLFTDNVNDTLGINIAAATTARLLISTQTAAIAPLRFTKSATDYTGAVDGSVWYLTAGNSLKFYKNSQTTDFIFKDTNATLSGLTNRVVEADTTGSLVAIRQIAQFGLFNALSSVIISSTTVETSCISSSLYGSKTLTSLTGTTPQLVTGKKIRFTANGNITTKNSSPGTLTARMKLGSTVIASVSGFSLHADLKSPTNNFFIDASFTIRSASSTGTVVGFGSLQTDNSNLVQSGPNISCLNNLGEITVNCNTDQIFDFTFQFGTADVANTITINQSTLEYLN